MATILVVDDDANNRLLVKTIAEHHGNRVIEATDGESALALCLLEQPDLVVLDLGLPGMDGTAFIRRLRGDERTRGLRVALYTATQPSAALRDFMEMYGIRHFIDKPLEPQELQRAIERAVTQP